MVYKKKYFQITSSDKKNIDKYSKKIDCVVVNANIAIFNKKSIKKIVQNYNLEFIIDPMTYILQVEEKYLLTKDKSKIKPSLIKVFKEFYGFDQFEKMIKNDKKIKFLNENIEPLIKNIYNYQNDYIKDNDLGIFSENKKERLISSPYFDVIDEEWLKLNQKILKMEDTKFNFFRMIISNRTNMNLILVLINLINENNNIEIVEIWVENNMKKRFKDFVNDFKKINKKIIFKYISFDEIVVIDKKFANEKEKIEGFITAFGYGESRNVYPVGGGLPINKIYSLWKRKRIKVDEFFDEIKEEYYKINDKKKLDKEKFYLENVCECSICKKLLEKDGFNALYLYTEFQEIKRKLKNGLSSKRIMATQKAKTLTDFHYIENKLIEYDDFYSKDGFETKWYKKYFDNVKK